MEEDFRPAYKKVIEAILEYVEYKETNMAKIDFEKEYILRSKDTPILRFKYTHYKRSNHPDDAYYTIEVKEVYLEGERLLPKGYDVTNNDELYDWLLNRKVPLERQCVDNILVFIGDNERDPLRYIRIGKGLSLNDTYWVTPASENLKWDDYSLYKNSFDELIAYLVFLGKKAANTGNIIPQFFKRFFLKRYLEKDLMPRNHISSPEFTTNGMLRKVWVRKSNDVIYLRKAEEKENVNERDGRSAIHMEYYASQVAEAMGLPHVTYSLACYRHEDGREETVCECPLFTSEDIGFVSAYHFLKEQNSQLLYEDPQNIDFHKKLAQLYGYNTYADMMIFDSVILNQDRHLNNFGYLIDNNTGEYIGPAPLFDNGRSAFVTMGFNFNKTVCKQHLLHQGSELEGKYLKFDLLAETFAEERHIPMLETLKNFELMQAEDPVLKISDDVLEAISVGIRVRSTQILEILKEKMKNKTHEYEIER